MPLYPEHRTVPAALPVERITTMELEPGARQRRIEALEREAHARSEAEGSKAKGVSFAQLLESKQSLPPK